MRKLKDKLNKRGKLEQMFVLMLMFVSMIGVVCLVGCGGGQSCERPKCGSEDYGNATARGCSIPGCGGCLTSGKGCNTACWPQSCKVVSVLGSEKNDSDLGIVACDVNYYGGGCMGCIGCGQYEKNCYSGCIYSDGEDQNIKAFFYGTNDDDDEKAIGCVNGCGGCVASDGIGKDTMRSIESATEVD